VLGGGCRLVLEFDPMRVRGANSPQSNDVILFFMKIEGTSAGGLTVVLNNFL
jgi:hypothetical protein